MSPNRIVVVPISAQARAARGIVESALDCSGWRWSCGVSRLIDRLVILEEEGAR